MLFIYTHICHTQGRQSNLFIEGMFMKKTRGLFFFGIFAVALGIGFLSTSFKPSAQRVEAASDISYVKFDDKGIVRLGEYPQNIVTNISAEEIKTNGELKQTLYGSKYYIYNSKKYSILDEVKIDSVGADGRKLSNGDLVTSYYGQNNIVFEFSDIEWQLLKTGKDNTAYLISTRILDREIFNANKPEHLSYYDSTLFIYLNVSFKEMAFSNEDYNYLVNGKDDKEKVQIDIPVEEDIDIYKYEDKNLKQAGDFAILNNLTSLSATNQGVGVPYTNAAYWLNNFGSDQDKVRVCWAKVAYHQYEMNNQNVGVRPVIQVNYKGNSGGGGTTPSKSSSGGSGNATLGIGISFTILGAGGLIAFFILWAKKHPSGKPPIWIIASLAGTLVISVVGLGCLAGGMTGGGGAGCFKTGYYVQTNQYSGGGIAQVGYTAWLIKSDGTVSYCSSLNDKTNASDFVADGYMTGTYKINGSKLVINIPKHEIKNFGTVGGTYTYTIKGCENFQNSDGAYHWVRGE